MSRIDIWNIPKIKDIINKKGRKETNAQMWNLKRQKAIFLIRDLIKKHSKFQLGLSKKGETSYKKHPKNPDKYRDFMKDIGRISALSELFNIHPYESIPHLDKGESHITEIDPRETNKSDYYEHKTIPPKIIELPDNKKEINPQTIKVKKGEQLIITIPGASVKELDDFTRIWKECKEKGLHLFTNRELKMYKIEDENTKE